MTSLIFSYFLAKLGNFPHGICHSGGIGHVTWLLLSFASFPVRWPVLIGEALCVCHAQCFVGGMVASVILHSVSYLVVCDVPFLFLWHF